jgi:hypothetical protein
MRQPELFAGPRPEVPPPGRRTLSDDLASIAADGTWFVLRRYASGAAARTAKRRLLASLRKRAADYEIVVRAAGLYARLAE